MNNQQHHVGANSTPMSNIPRVNSLNAIPIVFGPGSKIVSNVYHVIWRAMYSLAADPHPKISSAAQIIIDEIRSRSFSGISTESLKESKSNSSISESSSPNTAATFSISESPPSGPNLYCSTNSRLVRNSDDSNATTMTALGNNNANNHATFSTSPFKFASNEYATNNNSNQANGQSNNFSQQPPPPPPMPNNQQSQQQVPTIDRITKSANISLSGGTTNNRARRGYASSRDNNISEDDNRSQLSSQQKPLIGTDFVDWCTKYFIDPENNYNSRCTNSKEDQQREWRMLRCLSYKNVCLRELQVIDPIRFNESLSSFKVLQVPNLVAIHPYDPIMVIAGRDEFSVIHMDGSHVNNYESSSTLTSSISSASLASNSILNGSHHHHNSVNHHFHHNGGNILSGSTSNDNVGNHSGHDLIGTQNNCRSNSSQITSLQLINPQYNTLVCTGSSDGSVKIWRAYNGIDYSFNPQLVTAFHLMPELQSHHHHYSHQQLNQYHPSHHHLPHQQSILTKSSLSNSGQNSTLGMILLWDQYQSRFYATSDQNDVRTIKVWDAQSESKIQDIPTCAEFGVSCLSSDGEHSIAAGFLDGSIRIYDTRLKKTDCRTFTFRKHSEKILTLHMFKPGEKHINLVSGDSGGEVRFWDKRAPTSVKRVDVGQKMSVMSVHPNADVFAW